MKNIKDYGELKIDFTNSSKINNFYSQSGQDIFVLTILNGLKGGFFLEIGAGDPLVISNTYLLEKEFEWNGIQIEIDELLCEKCKKYRTSTLICGDAEKMDYNKILSQVDKIDYLSLDIDGIPTLEVLKKLLKENYKINVITFEHDSYKEGNSVKNESRNLLQKLNYELICSDVKNNNNCYEDWYVHSDFKNSDRYKIMESVSSEWEKIIFK